jgi:hypothetical protein
MAIAFNGDGGSPLYTGAATSTPSVSATVTAGTDIVLLVMVNPTTSRTVTSVTYNGTSMTALAANSGFSGTGYSGRGFYLLNPSTGSNTLAASLSGTTTDCYFSYATYSGVGAVTSGNNGSDGGSKVTAMPLSVTTSQTGEWGVMMCGSNAVNTTRGTNLNATSVGPIDGAWNVADSNGSLGTAGTYTLQFNQSPTDWWYGGSSFSLQASAAAATSVPSLTLLGAGA